jgi:ribosomal protein S8E
MLSELVPDSLHRAACVAQADRGSFVCSRMLSRLLLSVVIIAGLALPSSASAAAHKSHGKVKTPSRSKAKAQAGREREAAEAMSASKVAILEFRGDSTDEIRAQIIKVLRPKVRELSTNLRAPDTVVQYRDMGAALDLALYVHGHLKDMGKDQSTLTIDLRSAVSGQKITSVKFTGSRRKLYADAEDELWSRIEKPFGRACLDASKAVRHHSAPMRIEAGTPIEDARHSAL